MDKAFYNKSNMLTGEVTIINKMTREVTIEKFVNNTLITDDLVTKYGYKLDNSIHEKVWSHCASPMYLSVLKSILEDPEVETEMEICVCKEDEAGIFETMGWSGMGWFVKGTVTAMFTRDIASKCKKEYGSKRIFSTYDLPYLVDDYNKLIPSNKEMPYTETFLIPKIITGLWITKEMKKKIDMDYVRKRLTNNGQIPIYIV